MKLTALPLEVLLQRISLADAVMLGEPKLGAVGLVHVDAVVADFLDQQQFVVDQAQLLDFSSAQPASARNRLQITLLLVWLLDGLRHWLRPTLDAAQSAPDAQVANATDLVAMLRNIPSELARYTTAIAIVGDVERREEFARLTLARLNVLPAGENAVQAQDRLNALSSAERSRLMALNRAAEARARELHAAMARKAAEEAADKMGRE